MKADVFQLVRKDQGSAVVAVIVVEGEAVHDTIQRGHHPGAGGSPDIYAEMEAEEFFGHGGRQRWGGQ